MTSTLFKIVAIQTHKVDPKSPSERMYKVLKPDQVYYLLGGYELKEGLLVSTKEPIPIYGDKIEISAIVGENGSGKSSLIELMIRSINNFACYLLGEFRVGNVAAEHLHYIENVKITIHFIKEDKPGKLHVDGRKVVLTYGDKEVHLSERNPMQVIKNSKIRNKSKDVINTDGLEFIKEWGGESVKERNEILSDLFYTIVNNYSIYAYNSRDFLGENTETAKAEYIYYEGKQRLKLPASWKFNDSDKNWLKGVFYKNDGYTTPIVLTPFRVDGNIDINKENEFSQIRLLSMLLHKNAKSTADPYPFRRINKTKLVQNITIGVAEERYGNDVEFKKELCSLIGVADCDDVAESVQAIRSVYHEVFQYIDTKDNPYLKAAENYLIYKMIRISINYKQFEPFHIELKRILRKKKLIDKSEQVKKLSKKYVMQLINNPSHITQKWRQALALCVFPFYENRSFTLEEIGKFVEKKKGKFPYPDPNTNGGFRATSRFPIWEEADLLPPSFINPEVQIFDEKEGKKIPFNTLSSGERQMVYFVYGFAYHLINVNSAREDGSDRVKHRYVLSVFEEIELYFHPDIQRLLVKRLLDAIQSLDIPYISGIHLLFVTHSPFILSDIPRRNCLFLNPDGTPHQNNDERTFGANMYDMLRSSFFLQDGTVGGFAKQYINQLCVVIQLYLSLQNVDAELHIPTYIALTKEYKDFLSDILIADQELAKYNNCQAAYTLPVKNFKIPYEQLHLIIDQRKLNVLFPKEKLSEYISLIDEPFVKDTIKAMYNQIEQS